MVKIKINFIFISMGKNILVPDFSAWNMLINKTFYHEIVPKLSQRLDPYLTPFWSKCFLLCFSWSHQPCRRQCQQPQVYNVCVMFAISADVSLSCSLKLQLIHQPRAPQLRAWLDNEQAGGTSTKMNFKLCVTTAAALLGLILAVDGAGATGKQQRVSWSVLCLWLQYSC